MPQGLGTGQLFADNYTAISLEIKGDELWNGTEKERSFKQELRTFTEEWNDSTKDVVELQTSGSTGKPKVMQATKSAMRASAQRSLETLHITPGSTTLLCLPLQYVAGKMMVVRALIGDLRLITAAPSLHPYEHLSVAPQFVALTPLQAAASLEVAKEKALLEATDCIILGGGNVSHTLEDNLQSCRGRVYSTYGMTETFSHIALRLLNGDGRTDWYSPLRGVKVSLNTNGCLVVSDSITNNSLLDTNDIAEINDLGQFRILGRRDNVVCSGGIKLHLEKIEATLQAEKYGILLTSIPDAALGEALVCLYSSDVEEVFLREHCAKSLAKYEQPRYYLRVKAIPLTETGKPARASAKEIARKNLSLR